MSAQRLFSKASALLLCNRGNSCFVQLFRPPLAAYAAAEHFFKQSESTLQTAFGDTSGRRHPVFMKDFKYEGCGSPYEELTA